MNEKKIYKMKCQGKRHLNSQDWKRVCRVFGFSLLALIVLPAFTNTASGQQSFGGAPWMVPGRIEAEDYDTGGQGIAYNDTTAGNSGGQYRTDDVDIWYSSNPPKGTIPAPTPPANGWSTRWMWPPRASTSWICGWRRPTAGVSCG